ncbi:hypothetical protein [Vreelandella profundi]|uniref:hypothetical protein n=1 Tax=Vreelandella profundi TaxID=2852117 RepID=UPI001F4879CD|nr:hypothetical protein [Halomonas profundi]
MASWNLKELREKAAGFLNDAEKKELIEFLDSFDWKSKATYYHLLQADESFKPYFEMDEAQITEKIFSRDDEFEIATRIREFSLASAVMMANTLTDVLAQVLNVVSLSNSLKINDVTSGKVIKKMESSPLREEFEALNESDESKYIKAFTNTIKHIHLVKPNYHISMENGFCHGVKFKAFRYRNRFFPEVRDLELIGMVKQHRSQCIQFGEKINETLR